METTPDVGAACAMQLIPSEYWPHCAVCDRPVEELEAVDDPAACVVRFVARCHGALDRATWPWMSIEDRTIVSAVAFETTSKRALTAPTLSSGA